MQKIPKTHYVNNGIDVCEGERQRKRKRERESEREGGGERKSGDVGTNDKQATTETPVPTKGQRYAEATHLQHTIAKIVMVAKSVTTKMASK